MPVEVRQVHVVRRQAPARSKVNSAPGTSAFGRHPVELVFVSFQMRRGCYPSVIGNLHSRGKPHSVQDYSTLLFDD